MALIVQKYGGTSVAGAERIRSVARRVVDTQKRGNSVVVVVSAMAGVTDQLVALAHEISPSPDMLEYDMLVSTGEQQTIALLAMAIQSLGVRARSFTSAQVKVYTDDDHARARIHRIDTARIREEIANDGIAVLPGFQGVTDDGDITTLGRGGSDTSAVAVPAALGARAGRGGRARALGRGREVGRRHRQGVGHRSGYEGSCRRRGQDVRGALQAQHQHPDDQYLRDQDLRGDRREIHRARVSRAARR